MQNIAAIGCIEQVFKMILQILRGFPIQLPFGFLLLAADFVHSGALFPIELLCSVCFCAVIYFIRRAVL